MLVLTLVVLAVLFAITGFTVKLYHAKEKGLGEEWYSRGEQELRTGHAEKAVADLRTALVYSRDDYLYELRLAQALLASSQTNQARAYLVSLWEHRPEDATVNLELGRLAARDADVEQALRYFHSAIYGNWEDQDAAADRRAARLELYKFLISQGAKTQAQAELIALTAELPPDAELHAQVGKLFLTADEYAQALKQLLAALRLDRNQTEALAGAGEAEFNLGNYRDAQPYLERAVRKDPHNSTLAQMLVTTNLVLSIDPDEAHLSPAERSARVVRAFKQALSRLEECAQRQGESLDVAPQGEVARPQTPLQSLYEQAVKMKPRIRERTLSRDPELSAEALAWVAETESLTALSCGAPTGLDQALLLIARNHGGPAK